MHPLNTSGGKPVRDHNLVISRVATTGFQGGYREVGKHECM